MSKYLHRLESAFRLLGPGLRMPAYLLLFVTHRCDAKCGHCFFWRKLNDKSFTELSLEEIDLLARSIGPLLQVTLTGGSPELRTDLPKIARIFSQRCDPVNITVCCNGFHTEQIARQVSEMLAGSPEQQFTVGISLDGVGETHDIIRGMPGLFSRVVDTVSRLHRLKEQGGRLQLICAACVSELNHDTVEATAEWARTHLPVDFVKPILVRGKPRAAEALGHRAAETYLRMVGETRRHSSMTPGRHPWFKTMVLAKERVQRDLIAEISKTGSSPIRCSAARETAVIYADGSVAGCELREERLGNLRETGMDFRELWQGAPARKFRALVRDQHCVCFHHCFIAPMIFRSPQLWYRAVYP